MNQRRRRYSITRLALLAASALAGCDLQPKSVGPAPAPPAARATAGAGMGTASAAEGPFAPVSMSLHPLSRFAATGDGTGAVQLEAYVELFDPWGDGVKALGVVIFELYRIGDAGEEQVARWSENLADPDANAQRYDRVTRCYRFKLDLPETGFDPGSREGYELRARFTTAGGRTLSASRVPASGR